MADRIKIAGVLVKSEAVRLTDSIPTAALNAVRIQNIPRLGGGFLEGNMNEAATVGSLGKAPRGVSGGRWGSVELVCEARGVAGVYPAVTPDFEPLIKACGGAPFPLVEGAAGTDTMQVPFVADPVTCTIYLYSFSRFLYKLVGCVGNMRLSGRAAAVPTITFTMTGVLRADPVQEAMPNLTLQNVKGPIFGGGAIVVGGVSLPRTSSFDFDLGNQIVAMPGGGAEDGHDGYEIADRATTLAMGIRSLDLATFNPVVLARQASLAVQLDWGVAAAPTYNAVRLQVSAWEVQFPEHGDESGLGIYNISGPAAVGSSGVAHLALR